MGTEAGRPVRRPRQCLKARVGWQGECVWSVLDASGTNGVWMSEASIGNCFVCRDAGPPTTGHTQAPGLSPWKKRKAKTVSSKSWQGSPYIEAQREHTRTHTHTTHMLDLHTPPTHTHNHTMLAAKLDASISLTLSPAFFSLYHTVHLTDGIIGTQRGHPD